jgi:spermidine/putrescine ABC transporter ATP-binding subunit
MAEVVLERLTKTYNQVAAVEELSLTIDEGEFLCLLGPSGSGKTTVLRLVAGFVEPTHGQIYIGRHSMIGVPPHKRNLGMVAQDYGLFPHMTVTDNISFGLRMRRLAREEIRQRVTAALVLVDLEGLGDRMPNQLSGGQQQRVALARALVTRPTVLLLDEPFGALDKKLREQLQIEVRQLHEQVGITTLLVTHDQTEALTMADRIAVMRQGLLEQIGTPQEIYEQPRTHFVADFIGLTNFIPVRIAQVGGGEVILDGPRGKRIVARAISDVAPDMEVEVAIRPEKITLTMPNATVPSDVNVLPGRITDVLYLGNHSRVTVILEDDTRCLLTQQNGTFGASVGDAVSITWPQHEGIVLSA